MTLRISYPDAPLPRCQCEQCGDVVHSVIVDCDDHPGEGFIPVLEDDVLNLVCRGCLDGGDPEEGSPNMRFRCTGLVALSDPA